MSSGTPRIVINTLERLVSDDVNRAQAFLATAEQEAWRARYSDARANWRLYPGVASRVATIAAPLAGDVYSGLFVRPDAGTYLTVDEGLAMLVDPTGVGADDSPYLYVKDPGLFVPGALPFTANLTAATVRWDVVECQSTDTVLESSSRDFYNPATGLFTPAAVTKARAARLAYRVRLGNPGTGFPGGAAGWLPLAVVAVPFGATSFAQCDLYDVRPLVSERVLPQPTGPVGNEGLSLIDQSHYSFYNALLAGYSESQFAGYLAGGAIRNSCPAPTLASFGTSLPGSLDGAPDGPFLEALIAMNQAAGFAVGGNVPTYLACLFPTFPSQRPLPRWARYSELPVPSLGRRVPNGPRGILCLTQTAPGDNGLFAPLSFPASLQLGQPGIGPCLGLYTNNFAGVNNGNFARRRFTHNQLFTYDQLSGDWVLPAGVLGSDSAIWTLTPGTHFPFGARSIVCSLRLHVSEATDRVPHFNVISLADGISVSSEYSPLVRTFDTGTTTKGVLGPITVSRPVPGTGPAGSYPDLVPTAIWKVQALRASNGSPATVLAAEMYIHGWEF